LEKGVGRERKANGHLPNGRPKGRAWTEADLEGEEAAKAVSFKLSMQMQKRQLTPPEEEEEEEQSGSEEAEEEESEESETMYDNLTPKVEEKKEVEVEEEEQKKESSSSSSSSSSEDEEEQERREAEAENYGGYESRYGLGGMMMHEEGQADAPRMHVLVAIGSTFAWVPPPYLPSLCQPPLFRSSPVPRFSSSGRSGPTGRLYLSITQMRPLCRESLYFMFISLLTIGLGDINVRRRDLMVLSFLVVIIGLSLVSMCIMVSHPGKQNKKN
jgi:hypothetical protein